MDCLQKAEVPNDQSVDAGRMSQPLYFDTTLLQSAIDISFDQCQNNMTRDASKLTYTEHDLYHYAWVTSAEHNSTSTFFPWDRNFLNVLGRHCIVSEIQDCRNNGCIEERQKMNDVVPNSCDGWDYFRRWVLVAMSCLRYQSRRQNWRDLRFEEGEKSPSFHIWYALHICLGFFEMSKDNIELFRGVLMGKTVDQLVDLFGLCEIMYWISGTGPFDVSSSAWGPDHLSKFIVIPAVLKASIAARSLSVCQRRLWSFIKASDRLEVDLPAIVSMTSRMSLDRERQHHECTEEFCRFNNVNSTWVRQLHKCGNKACSETFFPPAEVERAVLQNLLTAWTIRQAPEVNCHDGTYMALSHLWADGTGIGLEKPGKVNRCLIDYYVDIARRLECDGIWWDTICVPIEPEVRRKALSMMHKNFERAKCTVVHDESLINYEWRDDGSPCLALALSPWFTRCWTALELYVSTKVVVLFKNPDGKSSQPLLKDLDNDILANDNAYTSLPHRLASSVIQRLRRRKRKERLHVEDLLAILRARNTSWATDRMIVAGLMAELPEFDSGESQSQITRKILTKCGLIPSSYLLHSHISPNEYGPWSWCPTSLYDLHSDLASKNSQLSLTIRHDGTATGDWFCNTLTEEKAKMLQLHNLQMSVKLRIMKTMQTPRSCMILRPWPWLSSEVGNQCLLVETVGLGYDETRSKVIECRYIGTVTASIHLGWQYVSIRIGLDQGKEEVDAQEMVSACSPEENAGQMLDEGINRVISRMRADEFASIEDVRDLTWALTGLRDQSL